MNKLYNCVGVKTMEDRDLMYGPSLPESCQDQFLSELVQYEQEDCEIRKFGRNH